MAIVNGGDLRVSLHRGRPARCEEGGRENLDGIVSWNVDKFFMTGNEISDEKHFSSRVSCLKRAVAAPAAYRWRYSWSKEVKMLLLYAFFHWIFQDIRRSRFEDRTHTAFLTDSRKKSWEIVGRVSVKRAPTPRVAVRAFLRSSNRLQRVESPVDFWASARERKKKKLSMQALKRHAKKYRVSMKIPGQNRVSFLRQR